jgi:uncharacterized protein YjbJ (UPF0337 family)
MEDQYKAQDIKGRAKEAAGALTGDDDLKAEGQADQMAASVKDKLNRAKDKLEGAVDKAHDSLTKRD